VSGRHGGGGTGRVRSVQRRRGRKGCGWGTRDFGRPARACAPPPGRRATDARGRQELRDRAWFAAGALPRTRAFLAEHLLVCVLCDDLKHEVPSLTPRAPAPFAILVKCSAAADPSATPICSGSLFADKEKWLKDAVGRARAPARPPRGGAPPTARAPPPPQVYRTPAPPGDALPEHLPVALEVTAPEAVRARPLRPPTPPRPRQRLCAAHPAPRKPGARTCALPRA
jgi:hypothetical protein